MVDKPSNQTKTNHLYLTYMYEKDLSLNNLQWVIYYKNKCNVIGFILNFRTSHASLKTISNSCCSVTKVFIQTMYIFSSATQTRGEWKTLWVFINISPLQQSHHSVSHRLAPTSNSNFFLRVSKFNCHNFQIISLLHSHIQEYDHVRNRWNGHRMLITIEHMNLGILKHVTTSYSDTKPFY